MQAIQESNATVEIKEQPTFLPPRSNDPEENMKAEKVYRTGLSRKNYLSLEIEAMERDLTAYKLTQAVMTLYLTHQLIYLQLLPEDLQQQINDFFGSSALKKEDEINLINNES